MEVKYRIYAGPVPAAPPVAPVKFWSMATVGENEAEITLYGDILDHQPVDWWTGEPEPGMFITPEGFLEDLEAVRGKSRVTVRINSVGGDLYTGMAIRNQLKSLSAEKVVIIDGIAASAASLIATAGDVVKIPVGGAVMIHEASLFLHGGYDSPAIKAITRTLEAANKMSAEAYAESTGQTVEAIRSMMAKTTWLIGQEAVDKGFATELLEGESPTMSLSADRRVLMVAGQRFDVEHLPGLPDTIPILKSSPSTRPAAHRPTQKTKGGGNKQMDPITLDQLSQLFPTMTAEQLREAFPTLVASIEQAAATAATTSAIAAERERFQQIDKLAGAPGMTAEMLTEAKYGENPCSAEQLSVKYVEMLTQQQGNTGQQHLAGMAADYQASGASGVRAAPNGGTDDPQAALEQRAQQTLARFYNTQNGGANNA